MRRRLPVLAAALTLGALAACAPADQLASSGTSTASGSQSASPSATCSPDTMKTRTPGTLTVGTDKPAHEPWFSGDAPANGKGYESPVAYAVANRLGYAPTAVKWAVVSFNSAIAPGPKAFDVDINQISITDERKKNLDFSTGYYDVAQSVVTVKGSKAEAATSIADLKKVKLGAQVGTTSYTAATKTIAPEQKVAVYNTNDDAKAALQNGQIDGLVVHLPARLFPGRGRPQGRQAGRPGAHHRH